LTSFNEINKNLDYFCVVEMCNIKNSKMNRIKKVLEEKGIKQVWLAEQLGKSYNMVNSYAQNRRQPSIEDLYKIAELLKVDARDLLTERPDKME
jgi:transcriptional regulator with XRE-family HTH domain